MNTTRIRQALDMARIIIMADVESIEERSCEHYPAGGTPRIETMDPLAIPEHRRCLLAVKLIDEALKEIEA